MKSARFATPIGSWGPPVTIEFQCDGCFKTLRTGDDKAGLRARCPQCGKQLTVPEVSTSEDFPSPVAPSSSPLGDFAERSQAPPPPPPPVGEAPRKITCPMCGTVNDSTTDRCLSCGEPFSSHFETVARGGSTRLGDIWNTAWGIWTANLGINIAAAAICGAIIFAVNFGLGIVVGILNVAMMGAGEGVGIILNIVQNIIVFAIYAYFLVGFSRFALANVRQQNPGLEMLRVPGERMGTVFKGLFVYYVITFLLMLPGLAAVLVGAMTLEDQPNSEFAITIMIAGAIWYLVCFPLVIMLLWPVPYFLAEPNTTAGQALREGPRLALRFLSLSLLMGLIHLLLISLGWITCCVGLLFAYPLSFILFAVAYDRVRLAKAEEDGLMPRADQQF